MGRVVLLAFAFAGCRLNDAPMALIVAEGPEPEDAGTDGAPLPGDAGTDAGPPCEVDVDGDRACAGEDCDDTDPRRSPLRMEYCPDRVDNDCDGLTDFADECGTLNDSCEGALAILRQVEDRDQTFWQFDLPLDHYQDDVVAGLSAGGGDCTAESGRGGRDAIFQIVATTDALVEVTGVGSIGALPILVLQRGGCSQGGAGDVCDTADAQPARLSTEMAADDVAWLLVDDAASTAAGGIQVEVRITKRLE